jgi:hypothetical protein
LEKGKFWQFWNERNKSAMIHFNILSFWLHLPQFQTNKQLISALLTLLMLLNHFLYFAFFFSK